LIWHPRLLLLMSRLSLIPLLLAASLEHFSN
jgi:hypothetical protein